MTTMPNATELAGSVTGVRQGGEPPGFTAIDPSASFYVGSNGFPCTGTGGCGAANGTASVFLQSAGENNNYYYPSYSPEMSYILFNRAAATGMNGTCSVPLQ